MSYVYVINKDGQPLMPTKKFGMVRHFLKEGKATVVSTKPFTIRLTYQATSYTRPLYAGLDPGRTHVGVAVINKQGEQVYAAVLETRNREVPKLMQKRNEHRKASRRGEKDYGVDVEPEETVLLQTSTKRMGESFLSTKRMEVRYIPRILLTQKHVSVTERGQ